MIGWLYKIFYVDELWLNDYIKLFMLLMHDDFSQIYKISYFYLEFLFGKKQLSLYEMN